MVEVSKNVFRIFQGDGLFLRILLSCPTTNIRNIKCEHNVSKITVYSVELGFRLLTDINRIFLYGFPTFCFGRILHG